VLIAVQPSVLGLYLLPVLTQSLPVYPPQTIISLPVQAAVRPTPPVGASVVLVALQLSVAGLYLPPVVTGGVTPAPQTIISLPVQTAVGESRPVGALAVLVAVQVSLGQSGVEETVIVCPATTAD